MKQHSSIHRWRRLPAVAVATMLAIGGITAVTMNTANAAVVDTSATYTLVSRHSAKAIDVYNWSTADGGTIVQFARNNLAVQQWRFVDSGGGYYRIRSVHSNKVLDFRGNNADGATLVQWTDGNTTSQQFRLADSPGGYVRFINRASGKALDVWEWATTDGARISQFTDQGGNNQQFQLVRLGSGGPTTSPSSSAPPTGVGPVARHGQLRVCGTRMCDRNNSPVQLRGVSSMWLNWENTGYAENLSALRWMRDNWNLTVIRAAMGVEPAGAYLSDPNKARGQVERIINNAVAAGVYVIVDWHAHEAQNHRAQAVSFFSDLARRYGHLPNVIWEPFNEPLQVSWTSVLKPYHEAVVSAIRASDPDNIVVLGTPTWSQGVDQAAASPVAGTNLMYTLHFYSCSHGAWLRDRATAAIARGLALFVTEWGASHADGGLDGVVCQAEGQAWINWMRSNGVSWTAWKLSVGTDSTNLLAPGAPVSGGWNNYLHGHASLVVAGMR